MGCDLSVLAHFVAPSHLRPETRAAVVEFRGTTRAGVNTVHSPVATVLGSGLVTRVRLLASDLPTGTTLHIQEGELVADTAVVLRGCNLEDVRLCVRNSTLEQPFHATVKLFYV